MTRSGPVGLEGSFDERIARAERAVGWPGDHGSEAWGAKSHIHFFGVGTVTNDLAALSWPAMKLRAILVSAAMTALVSSSSSGCDSDRPASTQAASASASAAGNAPSFATLSGQPIPFASVLAYSRGGAAIHVLASTHEVGCSDLGGAGFMREAGEITIELTLAPLSVVGAPRWSVVRVRLGTTTRQGDLGRVDPVAVDPRAPVRAVLDAKTTVAVGGSQRELGLSGTLEAKSCGVIPSARAEARPQTALTLSLDGRAVPIRGATYQPEQRRLRLSSEPHDCRGGLPEADVALSLTLTEGAAIDHAKLEGFTLERTVRAKTPGLSAATVDLLEDEGDLTVELSGEANLGGHPLALGGSASFERCASDPSDAGD